MKIGLLALSGIRAHDPELLALGLTLPGFVERSKQVAALPALGLLTIAACTPRGHELTYFEAAADGEEAAELYEYDLVAISTLSAQAFEAYAIADRLRAAGVRVAIGGLHASACPEEAARHADWVSVGEGEDTWPRIVAAAERGERAVPGAPGAIVRSRGAVDVATLPVPRFDLLGPRPYGRYTVQTSRGCPWRCDFCASTVMLAERYRKRPVAHVLRDVRALLRHGQERGEPAPFLELADDNTFVDHAWGKALCRALAPLRLKWFTETDVSVADDPELLDAIAAAGCRQLLVGLESPRRAEVAGIELRGDFKARRADRYAAAVERIQAHGITVNGCFVLGLDGQGPGVFDDVRRFAEETGLYEVQVTVLTPFPGTPLHERLAREGRLTAPGRWELCTLFDVVFEPKGMSAAELRAGLHRLSVELYSEEGVRRRRRGFFATARGLRTGAFRSSELGAPPRAAPAPERPARSAG